MRVLLEVRGSAKPLKKIRQCLKRIHGNSAKAQKLGSVIHNN